jgi:hypothetical protein
LQSLSLCQQYKPFSACTLPPAAILLCAQQGHFVYLVAAQFTFSQSSHLLSNLLLCYHSIYPVTLASKAEMTEWMLSCNTTVNCDNLCFSSLTAVHYCVTFSLANSPFSTYLSSNQSIFQFQKHYSNIASVNVLFQQVYWMNWSNFLKELL